MQSGAARRQVCSQPREPVAQAWSDRAVAVDADRERAFPARCWRSPSS